eukprot:TRINITY_DN12110_c0_g1_i9.p3 TRINITY_DN12110_c0_g1~~TRINITY_DN12110_c0_g1_i9.p3  ORF type:complete len:265 (+),score=-20.01 TRINITY_DN12110_c0_g1_i9:1142-1936(+)
MAHTVIVICTVFVKQITHFIYFIYILYIYKNCSRVLAFTQKIIKRQVVIIIPSRTQRFLAQKIPTVAQRILMLGTLFQLQEHAILIAHYLHYYPKLQKQQKAQKTQNDIIYNCTNYKLLKLLQVLYIVLLQVFTLLFVLMQTHNIISIITFKQNKYQMDKNIKYVQTRKTYTLCSGVTLILMAKIFMVPVLIQFQKYIFKEKCQHQILFPYTIGQLQPYIIVLARNKIHRGKLDKTQMLKSYKYYIINKKQQHKQKTDEMIKEI